MDSACSGRISAVVTPCDTPEMSLQSSEIQRQPRPPKSWVMDSRACRDTYRPAVFADLSAPPAPFPATCGSAAFKATVRDPSAKGSRGAGAIDRAGSVVAPVPFAGGPGTNRKEITQKALHASDNFLIDSLQNDTSAWYLPRQQLIGRLKRAYSQKVSSRTRLFWRLMSGPVRGDRSRHPLQWAAGTRSGDRRDVSLSPVPASHITRRRLACDNPPSRICQPPMAKHKP